MNYSVKNVKKVLHNNNFLLKKKFGQNFIVDENIIDNILRLSNILEDTLVIEIGPGAGSLTNKLASFAKNVLCYEIDTTLKPVLDEMLTGANNVDIIYNDFLKSDVVNDIKKYSYKHLYVIANLPYYITTPIIEKIITDKLNVEKIVVMVQKEVGDRFRANVGSKDYNSLTIYLNYYFDIRKLMDVSRNVFLPKPNVDSSIIEFNKKNDLIPLKNEDLFFKLIRDSFKQKRKTLRNNLKEYDLDKIEEVLNKYGFDLSVRAEQLSIDIFIDISNNL